MDPGCCFFFQPPGGEIRAPASLPAHRRCPGVTGRRIALRPLPPRARDATRTEDRHHPAHERNDRFALFHRAGMEGLCARRQGAGIDYFPVAGRRALPSPPFLGEAERKGGQPDGRIRRSQLDCRQAPHPRLRDGQIPDVDLGGRGSHRHLTTEAGYRGLRSLTLPLVDLTKANETLGRHLHPRDCRSALWNSRLHVSPLTPLKRHCTHRSHWTPNCSIADMNAIDGTGVQHAARNEKCL